MVIGWHMTSLLARGDLGGGSPPAHPHRCPTAILGLPPAPPIEVFDANQSFQGRVYALDVGSNTWLGTDMHVGGCYIGVKIAFWHCCAPESKGHFEAAAATVYQPPP